MELWAEINRSPGLKARVKASTLLPEPTSGEDAAPENTIFDALIDVYRKLVERADDMIVLQVSNEVQNALKPHMQWLNSYACRPSFPPPLAKLTCFAVPKARGRTKMRSPSHKLCFPR